MSYQLNVRSAPYSAAGDGTTDDTAAFQNALNAAKGSFGAQVIVPAGIYRIKTSLTIPPLVSLVGVFVSPPLWWSSISSTSYPYAGSTLLAEADAGNENGTPFITLLQGCTLKGVAIFYYTQSPITPVPYPWTIQKAGDSVSVVDTMLVNPWQGIDLGTNIGGRHFVSGVYGQPLKTGIYVSKCFDVGRIENVHFWNFWTSDAFPFTKASGTALRLQRSDGQMVRSCVFFGYSVAIEFSADTAQKGAGVTYGVFTDIEIDGCVTGILSSNASQSMGVQMNNVNIIASSTGMNLSSGRFTVVNLSVGSPAPVVLTSGALNISSSYFIPNNTMLNNNNPMVDLQGGTSIVSGNTFQGSQGIAIQVSPGVGYALINNNLAPGNSIVVNKGYSLIITANIVMHVNITAQPSYMTMQNNSSN